MDTIIRASNGPGVQGLISALYDVREVQGFALGVHYKFVTLFRREFGPAGSIDDILTSGFVPTDWPDECRAAGFPPNLSPIYVLVYVTVPADAFRATYAVPLIVSPGEHAVFVETVTPFSAMHDRKRHSPLQGGISVSNANCDATGTVGGFLKEDLTGDIYLLSCNHVLTDQHCDKIVQPGLSSVDMIQQGRSDGGSSPADSVGTLAYVLPLQQHTVFTFTAPFNCVDAALGKINTNRTVTPSIRRLKQQVACTITKSQMQLGDSVIFVGKESDDQNAMISHFIARVKVEIEQNVYYNFGNVFEIQSAGVLYIGSLSQKGDSGSWVIRDQAGVANELCGMLFAGDGKQRALCCFIEDVLTELQNIAKLTFSVY